MKRIIDALELLTAQHDAISSELEEIGTVEVSSLARALGELADQIATHLAVEEQFLTTLGLAVPAVEHGELRLALADILASDLRSPELSTRIAAFSERWAAHAGSQEQAIFIPLAETITPHVLEDIGTQLGTWSEQSRCLAA
jgi:hypothetical protein